MRCSTSIYFRKINFNDATFHFSQLFVPVNGKPTCYLYSGLFTFTLNSTTPQTKGTSNWCASLSETHPKAPQPLPTFCIQFDLYCLPWLAQSCRQVNTARSHEWKPQSETARLHCIYLWNLTLCFQSLVTIHSLTSYSIWACLIFQLGVGTCFRDWISICHGSGAGVTATLFSEFSHNMSNLHRTWCYANVVKEQNNLLGTKHLHVEFPEQFKEQYVFGMWWSH